MWASTISPTCVFMSSPEGATTIVNGKPMNSTPEFSANRHRVFLPHQDWVVELGVLRVRDDVFREVDGDADDLQIDVRVALLGLFEQRYFPAAGCAPGGPEINELGLTVPLRDVPHGARQVGERKVDAGGPFQRTAPRMPRLRSSLPQRFQASSPRVRRSR